MNKTNKAISLKKTDYGYAAFFVASIILLVGMVFMALPAEAATFASISKRLGVGSQGNDVRNLQTFLASDYYIYPEGLVTGYYGGMTRAAVVQFQINYDIDPVGVVGPITLNKINNVIAAGYGIDVYSPIMSNPLVQTTNTSATFSWSTNESANAKVYYSTSPLNVIEAVGNFTEPSITGGSMILGSNLQTNQNIVVNNLQSNTVYHYVLESQDVLGNVSITLDSTFKTK